MATATPRVSVIIPCFNLGWCLPDAIQSVRAQTIRDYEIIVVDDGSTEDETRRRLSDIAAQGIRVIGSPNRGLSAARNLGIRHAQGDYVCSVDGQGSEAWCRHGPRTSRSATTTSGCAPLSQDRQTGARRAPAGDLS